VTLLYSSRCHSHWLYYCTRFKPNIVKSDSFDWDDALCAEPPRENMSRFHDSRLLLALRPLPRLPLQMSGIHAMREYAPWATACNCSHDLLSGFVRCETMMMMMLSSTLFINELAEHMFSGLLPHH